MPAIFFGHGNPMNALLKNAYTDGWASIGSSIPRPWVRPTQVLPYGRASVTSPFGSSLQSLRRNTIALRGV